MAGSLRRLYMESERVNPVLNRIYSEGIVESADGEILDVFPVAVKYDEGLALYNVVRYLNTPKTLEIGMAYAVATMFICQAHQENDSGQHTVYDPYQSTQWNSVGLLNLKRAGVDDLVRFYEAPSQQMLPELQKAGESFDFIFVDGAHLFDYAMLDLFYANELLNVGGYLMIHDLVIPSVRKALSFTLRNYQYEVTVEPERKPVSASKPWTRIASVFLQSPLEFQVWTLPFTSRQVDLYARNYCLLRKTGDVERQWDHYRAF